LQTEKQKIVELGSSIPQRKWETPILECRIASE